MPNKPNAKKALRQAVKRAARNKLKQDALKKAVRAVKKAVSKEEALKLIRVAQKTLDKAAKTGIIKKKTASRKLSRLMNRVNAGK